MRSSKDAVVPWENEKEQREIFFLFFFFKSRGERNVIKNEI